MTLFALEGTKKQSIKAKENFLHSFHWKLMYSINIKFQPDKNVWSSFAETDYRDIQT